MISFLRGTINSVDVNKIVVLTDSGVGYEVFVGQGTGDRGQGIELYTYLKVSENAMELYGFQTLGEKKFFELLISVKGVGPKGALNILGLGSIEEIKSAISRSDVPYLIQVSGMGKRTAERLCVELKNKVERGTGNGERGVAGDKLGEVVEGLVTMGYSREEVRGVVLELKHADKSTEQLLKEALKLLA